MFMLGLAKLQIGYINTLYIMLDQTLNKKKLFTKMMM